MGKPAKIDPETFFYEGNQMGTPERIDPVTFSVVWGGLLTIAAEMGVTLSRTAYSVAVREGTDFSTAVFDPDGNLIAQGDYSPGHLGSMAFAVRRMLANFPVESLREGDAIICNDPAIGSGHLPDIYMVSPAFLDDQLLGYAVNIAHQIDIGGAASGSQSVAGLFDNYQEGLRIMPTRLYTAGEPNADIFRMIEANVRVSDVLGDIRAQYASNMGASRRLRELGQRYGAPTLRGCMSEILSRSKEAMGNALRELKPGTYSYEDCMDDVGPGTDPVVFKVTVTVSGDSINVDWTGSGPQRDAGMNSYLTYTTAYSIAAVKSVTLPNLPQNQGIIGAITVTAPEGCFLNPRRPAPCGGRAVNSPRIYEVVMAALSQAVPGRSLAAGSHMFNPILGGLDPKTGQPFVCWELTMGGVGARSNKDGLEATSFPANASNVPIEVQESRRPVLFEHFGLIPDSAGAGTFRGGFGVRRDLQLTVGNVKMFNLGDRVKFAPFGLFGGHSGTKGVTLLNAGQSGERELNSKGTYTLDEGDVLSWRTSGAGGYGDPHARDPERVVFDVEEGLVSPAAARNIYGVVVDPVTFEHDPVATAALRKTGKGSGA
ncbi:hydantoinase B/oxoprolinase family protein [Mesorhizobium sp. M0244]|uniref:hydantoinase B/oxoprolinase family protein n=1 Tax=Mesorhizobium sp. M0244 TaxID=2956926 RepID=UPI00333B9228